MKIDLFPLPENSRRKKVQVLGVDLFRRKNSSYWQARVCLPGFRPVRRTTGKIDRQAAMQFARLLEREVSRQAQKPQGRGGAHQLRRMNRQP